MAAIIPVPPLRRSPRRDIEYVCPRSPVGPFSLADSRSMRVAGVTNLFFRPDKKGYIILSTRAGAGFVDTLKSPPPESRHMTEESGENEEQATADQGIWKRSTAPQSEYSSRHVGIGLVVFAIGVVITVGLPLVLA